MVYDGAALKVLRAADNPGARAALAALGALRAGLRQGLAQEKSRDWLTRVKQDAMEALSRDVTMANVEQRKAISARLEQLGQKWTRDYKRDRVEHDRGVSDAERRFAAMSPTELRGEILAVMSGQRPGADPRVLDALSVAARQTEEHGLLREYLAEARYTEPWRASEEGAELTADDAFLAKAKDGVMVKDGGGRTPFTVSEICDLLDWEEETAYGEAGGEDGSYERI